MQPRATSPARCSVALDAPLAAALAAGAVADGAADGVDPTTAAVSDAMEVGPHSAPSVLVGGHREVPQSPLTPLHHSPIDCFLLLQICRCDNHHLWFKWLWLKILKCY